MKHLALKFVLVIILGLGLTSTLLGLMNSPKVGLPVARAAEHTVCLDGLPTCTFTNVQAAVDAAIDGDVIKVASGTYTGVNNYGGLVQVVYISKSVTIRGGYTTAFVEPPDPDANPTVLDAQGHGRVFYITGSISVTIEGLQITGGDANGLGGTPWFSDAGGGGYISSATTTLNHNSVFNNVAADGGGLFLFDSHATIVNNTVVSNTAGESGGGLALYNTTGLNEDQVTWNGPATVTNNLIISNTATQNGGGILLFYSDATLSENTITANRAWYGGGLYVGPSFGTLISNTITTNRADSGGGLLLAFDEATVTGNTVTANIANRGGGGLDLVESKATISANYIISNTALGIGGGGMFIDQNSQPVLLNNIIADNQITGLGAGLYIRGSSPGLVHNTIARNTGGDGSGIYLTAFTDVGSTYSNVTLSNTILAGQTVGLVATAGNLAWLENTLWHGNGTDWDGSGIIEARNNFCGDPAFVDPAAGDYHLTPESAAVDKIPSCFAGISVDIDGNDRPAGTGYDLGADEILLPGTGPNSERISVLNGYTKAQGEQLQVLLEEHSQKDASGVKIYYDIYLENASGQHKICSHIEVTFQGSAEVLCSIGFDVLPGEYELYSTRQGDMVRLTMSPALVQVLAGGLQSLSPDVVDLQCEGIPDLSISKSGPDSTKEGQAITYTLTITNGGPLTATNLVITDAIPQGAHYVTGGDKIGDIISWTLPSLAANGGVTHTTFIVTATQTITNRSYLARAEGGYCAFGHVGVTTVIDAPESGVEKIFLPVIIKE